MTVTTITITTENMETKIKIETDNKTTVVSKEGLLSYDNYTDYLVKKKPINEEVPLKVIKGKIILCECGIEITQNHIKEHLKSKKHLNIMNNPELLHKYNENKKKNPKEKVKEYQKSYRDKIKEQLIIEKNLYDSENGIIIEKKEPKLKKEQPKENPKVICECGIEMKQSSMLKHLTTLTHFKKLKLKKK